MNIIDAPLPKNRAAAMKSGDSVIRLVILNGYNRAVMNKFWLLWVAVLLSPGLNAVELGETDRDRSEKSVRISLSIQPSLQVSVSNQIDINIGNITVDTNFEEQICITGQSGGRYRLTAQGFNDDFRLRNSEGGSLPFFVFFRGDLNSESFDELQSGKPSKVYDLAADAEQCGAASNFRVTFRSEDLMAVESGLYVGSLTLLASPL